MPPRKKQVVCMLCEDQWPLLHEHTIGGTFPSTDLRQRVLNVQFTIVNKGSCFQNESPSGRSRTCPFVIRGARSAPPNDVGDGVLTDVTLHEV